jgi:RNA polymerase sigma-70 factor (ECF subfamily)
MPTGDKELLKKWREGDKAAGVELFERHYDSIARFFANKVGHGVDDLIQNTFLACVEGKERFREDSSFRTYLFGIARNLLYQAYRVQKRDGARFDFSTVSSADLSPGLSTMISKREEEQLLLVALRNIPVEHQIILEMYYWESRRAADIAELLDVPEGTVRTRLRRAKQLLEQQLQAQSENEALFERTLSGLEDWAVALRAGAPKSDKTG